MTNANWQPKRSACIVTLEGDVDPEYVLTHCLPSGADLEWIAEAPAVGPNGERRFADDHAWEHLKQRLEAWTSENPHLAWRNGHAPGGWDLAERRRFIQYIVEKLDHLGPEPADMGQAVTELGLAEPAEGKGPG